MLCPCHGESCYWQKDARRTAGGWWECSVRRRAYNAARATNPERRERICQSKRDRYDQDPVHRISHNLKSDAAARRRRLERRKEELHDEVR